MNRNAPPKSWLFLTLMLSALPLATIRADDEKAAKWVKSLGGKVTRAEKEAGQPILAIDLRSTLVADKDLVELAGLKHLKSLDLSMTFVTGAGMKELASLEALERLDLVGAAVTDAGMKEEGAKNVAGLKELAPLKNLQWLGLNNAQVTDKTLSVLKEAGLLHALPGAQAAEGKRPLKADDVLLMDLRFTRVADVGLKELAGLKNLKTLELDTAQTTDAALGALREASLLHLLSRATTAEGKPAASAEEVVRLDLSYTPVTSAALKELAGLKNLQTLSLSNTLVADGGFKELAELTKLESLNLGDTKVTDAALEELAGFKSLRNLYLYRDSITPAAVKKFRAGLPECRVLR